MPGHRMCRGKLRRLAQALLVVTGVLAFLGPSAAQAAGRDYAEFNVTGRGNASVAGAALTGPLATAGAAACLSDGCTVVPGDVTLEALTWTPTPNATDGGVDYVARLRVATAQYSHAVELATRITPGVLGAAVATVDSSVTVDAVAARGVRVVQARPDQCGDRFLQPGEQCDDGNAKDGDGCSATCQLESGFMCRGFVRDATTPDALGHAVHRASNGTFSEDTAEGERCTMLDICARATVPFQPALWTTVFSAGTPQAPAGFYCTSFCDTFEDPRGWEMLPTSNCQYVDVDECARGETVCDFNAYCENLAVQVYTGAEGEGYTCRCDPYYFVSAAGGMGCTSNGVDIVLTVAGKKAFDEAETPLPDVAVLNALRQQFIALLVGAGYTTLPAAVVEEGCIDYPPELERVSAEGVFATRALWKLHVRLPTVGINLPMLAQGDMLHSYAQIGGIFDDATTADADLHRMHTRDVCENDSDRTCVTSADCLSGAACLLQVPDIDIKVLSSGGALAPIDVEASGMEVMSVEYDITQTAWRVRVRYDNTVPNTINVLYLPHITYPVDNEELATFRHDEFACLPLGTGEFQQRRENTVCCLSTLYSDYTTTVAYEAYINNTSRPLGAGLAACAGDGTGPPGPTSALLDGSLDFVTGPFARMSRSYAALDPVPTRGYQDVLLFLAEEDMRALAGVETGVVGGYRLRFFVGMAHLQGLPNTHMHSVFSHEEVVTEITESFVFTTSSATEFTFVQDIVVDLLQVRNKSSPDAAPTYRKFARVGVSVPVGTTADEVHGILPFSSARVAVGFSEDTAFASATGVYYPCLDVPRTATAAMLDEQGWCAFRDPLCQTLGPTAVTAGGQVYFIFPLRDDVWDAAAVDRTAFFQPSLYLDFMLSTRDSGGRRIMTRVQTRTEIAPQNIASMCDEERLDSALSEILSIDLLLGLTPNETQMEDTLVQSLDVTRAPAGARHLERATSSLASNVLTVLLKGDDAVFAEPYAAQYGLELEDFVTMHFLDTGIRAQVEALMAAGLAFRKEVDPASYTNMRILPTDALLALCPLQATRNVQGCIMRREVQARLPDITTRAVTNIAPEEDGSNAEAVLAAAGDWTQALLGASAFVEALGRGHAATIAAHFALNNRYRRGFMISPTIPWRQGEMDAAGFATSLDLAQESISVALVTLDKNVDARTAPIVQVSIPAVLEVPPDDLRTDTLLQMATELSYADAADVNPNDVSIDLDSIQATESAGGRRLLAAGCTFDMDIAINTKDIDVAMEKAADIRAEARKENSPFSKKLVRSINRRVRAVKPSMPPVVSIAAVISQTREIAPPVNIEQCQDKGATRVVVNPDTTGLSSGWFQDNQWLPQGGGGYEYRVAVTCTKRSLVVWDKNAKVDIDFDDLASHSLAMTQGTPAQHRLDIDVSPRGPQTDGDWLQYERVGAFAVSPGLFVKTARDKYYAFWLDFCADPPAEMYTRLSAGQQASFLAEWARVRSALAAGCCVCGDAPKKPGTSLPYKQQYSWMWGAGEVDPYNPKMYQTTSDREADILYLNFQFLDDYTKAHAAHYDTALLPPALTRATCGPGEYWHSFSQCKPCVRGYYKEATGPYIAFETNTLQKTLCTHCGHGRTTLGEGATSGAQCVCAVGYEPCQGDVAPASLRLGPSEEYPGSQNWEDDGISPILFSNAGFSDIPNGAYYGQMWGKGTHGRSVIDDFVVAAYNRTASALPVCALDVQPPCRVPVRDDSGAVVPGRCLNFGTAKYPKATYGDGSAALPCVESLILYVKINSEMQHVRYFYQRTSAHRQYDWLMWQVPTRLSWEAGTMGVGNWAHDLVVTGSDNTLFSRPACDTGCWACPRGTYKGGPGQTACLSCAAGYVTRVGATDIAQCHREKTAQSKYTETPLYDPVLGLLAFNEYTDPKWTDPPVFFRSNERRCAIMDDDVSVSCPDQDHLNVLPRALPANDGSKFYYSGDALFPGTLLVAHPHAPGATNTAARRIVLDRRSDAAGRPGYAPSADFSKTVMSIGLSLFDGYMGAAPPGFVQEVFAGQTWAHNTVLNYRLRMYEWSGTNGINLVSFVSSKRLDTAALSVEWQYILCSDTRNTKAFYFCAAGPDYDELRAENQKHPYILDGMVAPIKANFESGHCWQWSQTVETAWWSNPCPARDAGDHLLRSVDGTLHWKPFAATDTVPPGPYYVYTIFTRNPSKACTDYGCAETTFYRQGTASSTPENPSTTLYFLPGTEITYGVPEYAIPAADLVTSALFKPTLGLLAPPALPRVVFPATGLLQAGDAHKTTRLHVARETRTVLATTGQGTGPSGAPILLLDETAGLPVLRVGVAVTVDWSATPTHPFGLSTAADSVVPPLAEHVEEIIDTTAQTTRITVQSAAAPPLFYLCSIAAHGFAGVPIPVDISAPDDERWCRLSPDGVDLECRQMEQAGGVTVYPELYSAAVPEAMHERAIAAPHVVVEHIPACGPVPYVVDTACTLQPVGVPCADTSAAEQFVAAPVADAAAETRYVFNGLNTNAASGAACTSTPMQSGMGCANAAADTAGLPWELPVLATSAYTHTSSVVDSDDGWGIEGGGGWCPDAPASDPAPALTLDLGAPTPLVGVAVGTRGYTCCYSQFFETFAVHVSTDGVVFTPTPLDNNAMSRAIVAAVAASDSAVVGEHTVLLFSASESVTARYVKVLPTAHANGCLRASALGVPTHNAHTVARFDNTQTLEPYLSFTLPSAPALAYVDVFLPARTEPYHIEVRAGATTPNPLDLPVCASTVSEASPRPFYVAAARDFVGWRVSVRCNVARADLVVVKFPLCETTGAAGCNPRDVDIDVIEVRAVPPQATFTGASPWSWSAARNLHTVTTLAAGIAVYDTYTYPHLEVPTLPGVLYTTLADVHRQWCGVRDHGDLWLQLDLGAIRAVGGVLLQAVDPLAPWQRAEPRVRVWHTTASVFDFATAVHGGVFTLDAASVLPSDPSGLTSRLVFEGVVRARFLRVELLDADEGCLRMALLDCRHACAQDCVDGGVYAVTPSGAGLDTLVAGSTHSMLRAPRHPGAAVASTGDMTFAALDPATHATAHTLRVTGPALADGDRLFFASNAAMTWASLTVGATSLYPAAPVPRLQFAQTHTPAEPGTRFLQNPYAAPNPFLAGADPAALAAAPYPTVHARRSSTTGLMPALAVDTVRGYMGPGGSGFVQKIPKAAWHTNSFFEMDLRVGILSHEEKPCPSTPRVRISTVANTASAANPLVTLSTNGYRMMQWHEPALHEFVRGAYGGFPTTVCNTPVDNAPCVIASGTGNYDCLDGSQVGASWIRCPAYFLDVVFFDPASQTTETVFMRLSQTSASQWIFWPVSRTDIRGQPAEQWALSRQGHYIFAEDPLQCAGCAACTVDTIVGAIDIDSPHVHVTTFITGRELDIASPTSTDWQWITCARYRGSPECPVGSIAVGGSACAPCALQPDGTSNCAGTPSVASLCRDGPDPDDPDTAASNNHAHTDILDGVVMALGSGDPNSCCSHVRPRVVVRGIDPGQNTDSAQACCTADGAHTATNLDTPGRIAFVPLSEDSYWFPDSIAALPECVQSIAASTRSTFAGLADETGPLPCRAAGAAFPATGAAATAYTVFDRVFVADKGWVLAALDAGDVATHDGKGVRRLAEAFAVLTDATADFNHNIPNDPAVFAADDSVFGTHQSADGTVCPERCETDGSYTSRDGMLRWAPVALDVAAVPGEYLYLYQIFSTGDSLACTGHNCQEGAAYTQYAAGSVDAVVDTVALFPGSTTMLSTDRDAAPTGLRRRLRAPSPMQTLANVPRAWRPTPPIRTRVAREDAAKRLDRSHARESIVLHSRHILQSAPDSDTAQSTSFTRTTLGVDPYASVLSATCPANMRTCQLLTVDVGLPSALYCLSSTELIENKQRVLADVFNRATGGKLSMIRVTSIHRPAFVETCVATTSRRRALLQAAGALDASLGVVVASNDPYMSVEIASSDLTLAGIQRVYSGDPDDNSISIALCIETTDCVKNATVTVRPVLAPSPPAKVSTPGTADAPAETATPSTTTETSDTFLIVLLGIVCGVVFLAIAVYVWIKCTRRSRRSAVVPAALPNPYLGEAPDQTPKTLYHAVPQAAYPQPAPFGVPVNAQLGYAQAPQVQVPSQDYLPYPRY